ncbi:MAG: LytR/AlgR family response regulator transcription factor [Leadbetterella sp.]
MNILVIEDEIEATKNILWLLQKTEPKAIVVGTIETVSESKEWLQNNPLPDLIITDIQLADGISFEIFDEIKVSCPIIFATAYNEFALKAFEVHSIDYLLKPIDEKALLKAFEKYKSLSLKSFDDISEKIGDVFLHNPTTEPQYRKSFLVRYRDKMLPVKTESFSFFHTKEGLVYGKTTDDKSYIIENTLEELELQLPPINFFRANRQYIISRDTIVEIEFYFNSRLLLKTKPDSSENILISKERVPIFKKWFEGLKE